MRTSQRSGFAVLHMVPFNPPNIPSLYGQNAPSSSAHSKAMEDREGFLTSSAAPSTGLCTLTEGCTYKP